MLSQAQTPNLSGLVHVVKRQLDHGQLGHLSVSDIAGSKVLTHCKAGTGHYFLQCSENNLHQNSHMVIGPLGNNES
jgi:hypothetical protein